MKTLVIGSGSDIYSAIRPLMDGHEIRHWEADTGQIWSSDQWDVCLIPMGRVAPVGVWWGLEDRQVMGCVESNILRPLMLLKHVWRFREPNAKIIFFAGSNPQKIMDGYAPYNISKMALIKAVEQLDHETPEATFVAFGPGYYGPSKIHKPTLDAGLRGPSG